jgi:hypothetical protein
MINTILPENFYQILRCIGSLVLPTLPDYEEDIKKLQTASFFFFDKVAITDYQENLSFRIRRVKISNSILVNMSQAFLITSIVVAILFLTKILNKFYEKK